MKTKKLLQLIHISIFAAIAVAISFFSIPVFFAPGFYKLDFSDTIVLISGFSLGPLAGVLTEALKVVLMIILKGSNSFGVGEFANFITGVSLVLPSAFIYKNYRTFKGACLSMLVGIFSLIFISACVNYFCLIPVYEKLFSLSENDIVLVGHVLNPYIVDKLTFLLFIVCPFNLLKGIIVCLFSLILYKKLSSVISKISIDLKN